MCSSFNRVVAGVLSEQEESHLPECWFGFVFLKKSLVTHGSASYFLGVMPLVLTLTN